MLVSPRGHLPVKDCVLTQYDLVRVKGMRNRAAVNAFHPILDQKIHKMCDLFLQMLEHDLAKVSLAVLTVLCTAHAQGETLVPCHSVVSGSASLPCRSNRPANQTSKQIPLCLSSHLICSVLFVRNCGITTHSHLTISFIKAYWPLHQPSDGSCHLFMARER